MFRKRPYLAAVLAASGVLAGIAAAARAETAALEIKKLEASNQAPIVRAAPADYLYRTTSAQSFNAAVGPAGSNRVSFGGDSEQKELFKKLVTKEPEYASEYPFRGVVKLGTQEYAFALDAVPEKKGRERKGGGRKDETGRRNGKDGNPRARRRRGYQVGRRRGQIER